MLILSTMVQFRFKIEDNAVYAKGLVSNFDTTFFDNLFSRHIKVSFGAKFHYLKS